MPPTEARVHEPAPVAEWSWTTPLGETDLHAVAGWGETVIVAGADGLLARYDGHGWERLETGTNRTLLDIWGRDAADFWVVGPRTLQHWVDGAIGSTGPAADAAGLAIDGAGDHFIVVDHRGEMRGQGWIDLCGPTRCASFPPRRAGLENDPLNDVAMTAPTRAWVVGRAGGVFHWDAEIVTEGTMSRAPRSVGWVRQRRGGGWYGIWAHSDAFAITVGLNGRALRWEGESWSPETTGAPGTLHDVSGSSPQDVFAVGDRGGLVRFDGDSWSVIPTPTEARLKAIWVGDHGVVAVGEGGVIGALPRPP